MQSGLSNASDTTLSLFFNCMWYLISSENFTQSLEKKSFPDLYFCLVFVCLLEPVSWSSGWGWNLCNRGRAWNLILPPTLTSPTPGLQACIITPGLTSLFQAPPLPLSAPNTFFSGCLHSFHCFLENLCFPCKAISFKPMSVWLIFFSIT